MEAKKASPSRGLIAPDFDPVAMARHYQAAGAAAVSVLTERHFFQGGLDDLVQVRAAVQVPVLRKDFIIDALQIEGATGKIAGPEYPPILFAKTGFLLLMSILIPSSVFIIDIPAAPASSQALAMPTMSVTFGLNFMKIGFFVTDITAFVTSAASSAEVPKAMPPL